MSDAKALVAKALSDETLLKKINEAKTEAEFDSIVGKLGYENIKAMDFQNAFKEAMNNKTETKSVDQVAVGLSMVGIDYAFTAVQASK